MGTSVSFVIRTYNESAHIGRLLEVLRAQEGITLDREVTIVDSGSTDNTVQIARQWPVKLIQIRKEEFDYSGALNLGIANSRGDLVLILSAHAIPCENSWLARMVSHFEDDKVAGVYCRQFPWPDANEREKARIAAEFEDRSAVYDRVPLAGRVPFTNSAGCIRRSVWDQHHFMLPWGEDFEWATWAVAKGFKIVYEANAAVYHSHNLTCRQAAQRMINWERAADLHHGRSRTRLFTLRQGAGYAFREIIELLHSTSVPSSTCKSALESLMRSYWFVRDFTR